ncbi:MAG: rhodanese-like domain-containing protein [Thiohalophilus sp.]|jgi:rhodanese-related sulfurtransferase
MYNTFKPEQPVSLMDFVKAAKSCIQECSPDELQSKMDTGEDMLLVDVRESSEHEQGHLPGARLIPRGILEAAADPAYPKHDPELANARDRQVVLYCATGGRSAMAAAVLQMMGFKDVISLNGGFTEWVKAGKDVTTEARYV